MTKKRMTMKEVQTRLDTLEREQRRTKRLKGQLKRVIIALGSLVYVIGTMALGYSFGEDETSQWAIAIAFPFGLTLLGLLLAVIHSWIQDGEL